MTVLLQTEWLWVWIPLQSIRLQTSRQIWSNYFSINSLWKYRPLSTRNLFGLCLDSFTILTKPLRTVLAFLSTKGWTQAHLVRTSITHNNYWTPWLKEDNDPISAKYAAQILFLNLEYTFLLLIFLIFALWNSWASISFRFTSDPLFYQKPYIHHVVDLVHIYKFYLSKSCLKQFFAKSLLSAYEASRPKQVLFSSFLHI